MPRIGRANILNTLISFSGAGLGFINQVVLMGRFFQPEELGLTRVLFQSATLVAQFMLFGTHPLVIRYFSPERSGVVKGLLKASWGILGLGIVGVLAVLLLAQGPFISFYSEKSALFVEFAYWVLPMAIGLALYQLLAGWAQVYSKSVLETGIKEVGLRLLFTLGISAYLFDWISFDLLVQYYAVTPIITVLVLVLGMVGYFGRLTRTSESSSIPWKEYLKFSSYNLFSRASNFVTLTIDVILLGALVGLEAVAIYSIATYLVSFMVIPNRAVQKVAFPRIALWWQNKDTQAIDRLYGDTSTGLIFWSGILYVGFYLATPLFVAFLGEEYELIGLVFTVFGFGRMIEMATSVNRGILRNSPKYKLEALFSIIFMIAMIGLDLLLIPIFEKIGAGYGAVGAAWGSVAAFFLFNGLVSVSLFRFYGMSPFRLKQLGIVGVLLSAALLIPLIQLMNDPVLDALIQLVVFGLISGVLFLMYFKKKANRNWLALK